MAGCAMDYLERPGALGKNTVVNLALAHWDRSSSASLKAYYGHSYSAVGDIGIDRQNSADRVLAQESGDGGGASTIGKSRLGSRG
jgi:hypothetical protein